jgi:hypothetical protein
LPLVNPTAWCVEGAKILELCEKGDKLLDDEIAKVYKGKKVTKGPFLHPRCTLPCYSNSDIPSAAMDHLD